MSSVGAACSPPQCTLLVFVVLPAPEGRGEEDVRLGIGVAAPSQPLSRDLGLFVVFFG